MKIHLPPRKRTIAMQCYAMAEAMGPLCRKKLCSLPHIFAKVLELPFVTDADISVNEDTTALRFVAVDVDGFSLTGVARTPVKIHTGVNKVIMWDL